MNRKQKLEGLKSLAALKFQVVQMDMAKLKVREAALRKTIKQLEDSKRTNTELSPSDDPALIAGANIRWHQWVDQRRASVNMELAQILAQKESCIARMKLAFGKNEATKNLAKRTLQKDLAYDRRRNSD